MASNDIRREMVWPAAVRGLHWVMVLLLTIQLFTGLLMGSGMILNDALYQRLLTEWHLPAGHLLAAALAVRLALLFLGRGPARWQALLTERSGNWRETLQLYLSMGKGTLPNYYAHNPLWAPLYLLFFGLLAAQLLTGFMLEIPAVRATLRVDSAQALSWHGGLFEALALWVALHVLTAFLHDWRGGRGDVSAMINGHKVFEVDRSGVDTSEVQPVANVSVHDLLKSRKKSDDEN